VNHDTETIAAIATPPGKGGVGIIRISGKDSLTIAKKISGLSNLENRYAHYCDFKAVNNETIDSGLIIYFKGPNSFTGEDVVELQGHGGPVILQVLLKRVIELGARAAKPGEFSERAFLNDKLDLAQAEAIADLINSSSEAAAKSAMRSLQGDFSAAINRLLERMINTRMYVESAIDFPEEEIDFLADGVILGKLDNLQESIDQIEQQASSGRLLQQGYRIALAGRPNAGKSTLLNTLSGDDVAIVTDIEGTTRDSIEITIDMDGLPVHIVDTAGLRESDNKVEQIGIERSRKIIEKSDHVLLLVDAAQENNEESLQSLLATESLDKLSHAQLTLVYTKQDLNQTPNELQSEITEKINVNYEAYKISAKTGSGIKELKEHFKTLAGFVTEEANVFSARKRHLEAIKTAKLAIQRGKDQLITTQAGELLAQELLEAQNALNSITGQFNADDLLGEIFSRFCIGK
jgi:tRNA modification GTPase